MNVEKDGGLVTLYNLYCVFLIPFTIILAGLWSVESGNPIFHSRHSDGLLPLLFLLIFLPENTFSLNWDIQGVFPAACSLILCVLLCKLAHYLFMVRDHAPLVFAGVLFILLSGTAWCVAIEGSWNLREHIMVFGQKFILFPCSGIPKRKKGYMFASEVALIYATLFLFTVDYW